MKQIIKAYLSLLKESRELDSLLPDLLFSMGFTIISLPQPGIRQYGVDVAATVIENDNPVLYLFTIKQGDIGRRAWDTDTQSVRQSLNDIKDVYLSSHVRAEHSNFKKKIILCTNGTIKQEIDLTWSGYTQNNTLPGQCEYEFWGIDELANKIEQYMLNEQLLPIELRPYLRKTLALISDPDYNLADYYHILNKLLLQDVPDLTTKKIQKRLRNINLLLNVIYLWAKDENNLKPAILAAERTILITWEYLRKNDLLGEELISKDYAEIYRTFFNIYTQYYIKIQPHCFIQDGLHGYSNNSTLECLNIFEQLGIISTTGIICYFQALYEQTDELKEITEVVVATAKALITNHVSTFSPYYDSHAIEISETILLLSYYSETEFIDNWIMQMIDHITFAYDHMGRYFPIQSDSIDDIISLNISDTISKEKLMEMSTLLPILAQWCAVLELNNTYQLIRDVVNNIFSNTTLQIWYPDKHTDEYLYTCNAAYKSGSVDAPITLPESIEEMKEMIKGVQANTIEFKSISSANYILILPLIASRHYRTPILPHYWQSMLLER